MGKGFVELVDGKGVSLKAVRRALLSHASHLVGLIDSQDNSLDELSIYMGQVKRLMDISFNIELSIRGGDAYLLNMDHIELIVDALSFVANDQVIICVDMLKLLGPLSAYWDGV